MALQREAVLLGEFILEPFDLVVLELDDLPAIQADQVIVVLVFKGDFVPAHAVAKVALVGDSALLEELQGSVDRGVANLAVTLANQREKVLDAQMPRRTKKHIRHRATLSGRAQSVFVHVSREFGLQRLNRRVVQLARRGHRFGTPK